MKLKRIAKVLLSCLVAGALFTGCGGGDSAGGDKPAAPAEEVKLGMITHLNANEKSMSEVYKSVLEKTKLKFSPYQIVYYDNLNAMQMGIEAGDVGEISLYDSVANYLVANNDKYEFVFDKSAEKLADSFCFAVRKDDAALKADLDKVVAEMKDDGSLAKLVKDYITDVDKANPPKVDLPTIDGADTIKVGVTGDLPPLDFVNTDRTPAGFNTALLAEIAKRLGKNIAVVQIDSGARAAALSSGQIDVIFWAILPVNEDMPPYLDKPEGIELSAPYFKDNVAHLKLKADK